jgi:hypothetical protein
MKNYPDPNLMVFFQRRFIACAAAGDVGAVAATR